MKKVAHYKQGGYLPHTESWIYAQLRHIQRHHLVFYCHGLFNIDTFPLEQIRNLNFRSDKPFLLEKVFNKIFRYYSLTKALKQDRPDLLHAHFGPAGYSLLRYKKQFGIPLVTTFYGFDLSMHPYIDPIWNRRYKDLFRYGDLFLTEGEHMRQSLIKLGCPSDKVRVQHLGIDLDLFPFRPRTISPGQKIALLIAGRFCEKKGIPYALAAVGICKQRHPEWIFNVTIIGDSNGERREVREKDIILRTIETYDLRGNVNFLWHQPHDVFIRELYKHHIFLSPSVTGSDGDTEGGAPFSIVEASATGMPILSSFHCDIPELVIDGVTGTLAHEKDINELADKLESLLRHSDLWQKLGAAGRSHIDQKYNSKTLAGQLETAYDSLLT